MPIKFYCPGCGNLMRTPDDTAGRKGRCPTCQLKVQIPASSVAARSPGLAVAQTAEATSATEKVLEPIRFNCGSCGKTFSVPAANAGKKGKCLHCGKLMSIPKKSPVPGARWKGAPNPPKSTSVSGSQFQEDSFGGDPFGPSQVTGGDPFASDLNPYSAPKAAPAIPVRSRKGERTGAEIATMICGGCLIVYAVAQIILVTVSVFFQSVVTFGTGDRFFRREGVDEEFATLLVTGHIVAVVLRSLVMLAILAGGIQMIRFKVWGLCLTACILTMVPCNCFCLLGLPIGIWGTVMLSLASVRSAFR